MAFYNTQHGKDLNLSKSEPATKNSQGLRKTAENTFFVGIRRKLRKPCLTPSPPGIPYFRLHDKRHFGQNISKRLLHAFLNRLGHRVDDIRFCTSLQIDTILIQLNNYIDILSYRLINF
jgi:hypothetical protein